ncbi:MAG TPA: glycosyltransferase [Elusimicrobiales bacterium]|nr:glycosyltransferase [Elusimicrobiales bacterium]
MEWLCAGRPVLASAVGGLPDIVQDGCGALLPPGDARALAEAACRLLAEPAEIGKAAAASRKRYEQLFTLEKFAAETYDFYMTVLGQKK